MSRSALRVLCLLAITLTMTHAPLAQSRAQNDKAAADAVKNKSLPLMTERALSFTTSEATWLSLDLSPDGKTIVFELLGDIYTLPVTGGEAMRITSGQAYDMQPAFSPDGKKLVFISDRNGSENLWIANADGSKPRAITTTERDSYMSPTWAPDGDYVIAAKGAQLWIYHEAGGSGVQMTGVAATPAPAGGASAAAPAILGPAFGKDPESMWVNIRGNVRAGLSTRLVEDESQADYDPHVPSRSSARVVGPYQIAQLNRENGRLLVRTHEHEGAFRPIPSPDGKWLVYSTRYDSRQALKLIDLSTGEDRWLTLDVQRDDSQGGGARDRDVYPKSAFTPDSKSLITSYDGKLWRVAVPEGSAVEIPFAAKVDQKLGPLVKFDYPIDDEKLKVSQIRGPRPSNDGKRIVFTALDRLWIADLPQGRGAKKEKPAGSSDTAKPEADKAEKPGADAAEKPAVEAPPKPAPDPPGPNATIRNARRLTKATDVEHGPVWSPDGQFISYVTWNDDDGGRIYRVRADGTGEPERLTPAAAFYDKLAYSRDGSRLLAVRGSKMHRLRTLEDFGNHSGSAELEYVWMPAAGGTVSRIAWIAGGSTQQGREAPHVGPDPDRVYVWAGSEGLLSMRYDGTDIKPVVKVTAPSIPAAPGTQGPAPTPDEVILSPDGKRALVRANRNVFMITVPPIGGTVPTVSAATPSSVPTWRMTKVGGDFIGWTADSQAAFFSIGRSFFLHDNAYQADVDAANRAKAETEAERAAAASPAPRVAGASSDDAAKKPDTQKPPVPPKIPTLEYEPHRVDVEIVVDKDKPTGTIALRNARLITMNGDEVIARGDIVITNNRITAIGPSGNVKIPAGAIVRNMAGKTIMPGLVDIHAHTWVAWGVHRSQVSQFLAQLAFGVTTQRDPQTSSEDALTYQDLMDTGQLIGPRLYSTGPGIFANDNIRSLEDARDVLRRYSDHYNTRTIKQYMVGGRKIRQWVIMAAKELGLTPTTEGGSNFTMNLTLMQDGYAGLEHTLPISPFFKDVVTLGAASQITYTPTLIVSYGGPAGLGHFVTTNDVDAEQRLRRFTPHDELDKWKNTTWNRADQYVYPLHAKQLTKWVEGGGKLGLGSHGEVQGLGTHWEMWMMGSGGMKPHALLKSATIDSADAIGFAKDIGSLEPGKLADLIVLDANPLEDIKNTAKIAEVMKNGRLYDAATLNETYPRQKALDPQWWWRLEPPATPARGKSGTGSGRD